MIIRPQLYQAPEMPDPGKRRRPRFCLANAKLTELSVWINIKLSQASLASAAGDREMEATLLTQVTRSPGWWSMDARTALKANALMSGWETSSGSVKKGVQMAAACLRSEVESNESPYLIASMEVMYAAELEEQIRNIDEQIASVVAASESCATEL